MAGLVTLTVNPTMDTTAQAESVQPDRKIRCTEAQRDPGGGGLNVARAITALGGEATAVWTKGGLFGSAIGPLLDDEGVAHVAVEIRGETRQSLAVIESGSGRHYRFSLPGPELDEVELDRIVSTVRRQGPSLLVLSGGLPPGVDPAFYARVIEEVASQGARVIIDSHGEALRAALDGGGVFLVKPNYREVLQATGEDPDAEDPDVVAAAHRLVADTDTSAVLVSLGAAGAVLVTGEQVERIGAPTVPIRSRIGAGDSMVGGLAWRLHENDDLRRAARYGVAAGTAAVMTPGTELCRREDTERLFASM